MEKEVKENLNIREKLTVILVIFLIKVIKPWEYDHQFDKFWAEIKETFNS